MARAQPEIDRLLDEGLTRYSRGDLEGALASWEAVLGLDPHNEQALGYMDYVRVNYELLAGEAAGEVGSGAAAEPEAAAAEAAAFAIGDEEPGYRIQLAQGELPEGSAAPRVVVAPDGWAIEDEEAVYRRRTLPRLTFEAPPPSSSSPDLEPTPFPPMSEGSGESGEISFDDATKEYGPGRLSAAAFDDGASHEFRIEHTPGFEPEFTPGFGSSGDAHTPPGFGAQRTEIRRRDLGFVQAPLQRPAGSTAALPRSARAAAPVERPPEPLESPFEPSPGEASPDEAPPLAASPFELPPDVDPPTIERSPMNPLTAELFAALPGAREPAVSRAPSPRPSPGLSPVPDAGAPAARRSTIEGLPPVRPSPIPGLPASPTMAGRIPVIPQSSAEPLTRGEFEAPTERRDPRQPSAAELALAVGSSRDAPLAAGAPPRPDVNALMAAPTRDLGLRQGAAVLAETEDAPTMTSGALGAARASAIPPPLATTHNDIVLPFDPIGARSASILEAIDRRSPPPLDESREELTRRRITALFEHAVEWEEAGELDRAVTAVDLALSEDPNSVLAQKLIHRNRETIMSVFQAFLGDLHRTPILARPLHELASSPISPRAAFLLSRVDGLLSLDEILDVSSMPRMEAYRYLCQLFLRGILR